MVVGSYTCHLETEKVETLLWNTGLIKTKAGERQVGLVGRESK